MAGGVCNNESDVIRSKDECTEALEELGYQLAKKEYWEGSKKNIPSGCSIRTLNNRPYLNTKPGVGRGRDDQIPICKGNGKLGKMMYYSNDEKRYNSSLYDIGIIV